MHLGVHQVELFTRQFVDAVHVDGVRRVEFVDREVLGPPVHLARGGLDDHGVGRDRADHLEEPELARHVQLQVAHRVDHRLVVADLSGDVEDRVDTGEHLGDGRIAHRRDDHLRLARHVGPIATVLGHEGVDHDDAGPGGDESMHQVGADESEPARDEATAARESAFDGQVSGHVDGAI